MNSVVGSYPGATSGGIIARNERIRTVAFQNIKKNKNRISIGEDTAPQRRQQNRGILTSPGVEGVLEGEIGQNEGILDHL